jgi:hypothetical protein
MSAVHDPTSGRLALFADCLLAGLLTAVAALPLVTAYPAFTAGCALLGDRVRDAEPVTVRGYLRKLRDVLRSGPAPLLAPPVLAALVGVDTAAVRAGLPGRAALAAILVAACAGTAVLGLRAAAGWRREIAWPEVARAAARRLATDRGGTALLLAAATVATGVAYATPLMAPLAVGPLALAAVVVDGRPVKHRPA